MDVVGAAFGIGVGRAWVAHEAWAPRFIQSGRRKVPAWWRGGGESSIGGLGWPVIADRVAEREGRPVHAAVQQAAPFRTRLAAAAFFATSRGAARAESAGGVAPASPGWAWTAGPPARAFAPGLPVAGQRFAPVGRADEGVGGAGGILSTDEARVFGDRLPLSALPVAGARPMAAESGALAVGGRVAGDEAAGAAAASGLMPVAPVMGRPEDFFEDYVARQARLPPAGGGAFDPRLTPVWFGQKLAL